MKIKSVGKSLYVGFVRLFSGFGLYRYSWIRRVNKSILGIVKSDRVKVHGMTLFLDRGDSLNLSINSRYEPEETAFVHRTVQPGQYVIDVGANIGYYSTLFASLVGPDGKVFSFEPDPENHAVLKRNVVENELKQVEVIPAAVSDRNGTLELFYSKDKGDQRIYDSQDGRRSMVVKSVTLDSFFENQVHSIDFVKIDVQGAEGYVLRGMSKLVKRNPGIILSLEFWPVGLEKSGFGALNMLELMDEIGLKYYDINLPQISQPTVEELMTRYSGARSFTNLICTVRK